MGYRWYEANNVAPVFPFGFGLSYTTFAYSGLSVSDQLSIRKTGHAVLSGQLHDHKHGQPGGGRGLAGLSHTARAGG